MFTLKWNINSSKNPQTQNNFIQHLVPSAATQKLVTGKVLGDKRYIISKALIFSPQDGAQTYNWITFRKKTTNNKKAMHDNFKASFKTLTVLLPNAMA